MTVHFVTDERMVSRWQVTLKPIVSPIPTMAAASVDEVKREGCQTSDVDAGVERDPNLQILEREQRWR
ncbi:hypothetical protein BHE74_00023459 [Ensete ventricosum]|nr:hypothetical protein BHE74_00023459 [Ensete ventricosum]